MMNKDITTLVIFRRTFFRQGFSAKLPDDTEYFVRFKNKEIEFAYSPFTDDNATADIYYH